MLSALSASSERHAANSAKPEFYLETILKPGLSDGRNEVPKYGYDALKVHKKTPLPRQVLKEFQSLKQTAVSNDQQKPYNIRVPVIPRRLREHERTIIIQEPLTCPTERETTSPLAVRLKKKVVIAFKRLTPGLTKSENFIPSTVLGNVADYEETEKIKKRIQKTSDLVSDLGLDMRKIRALVRTREETIKPKRSPDRSNNCLENFEQKMEERRALTRRLASQLTRRVSQLVLNSNEDARHKRELQDLADINRGPRPLYQIYIADKKSPIDPELFFNEPPYKSVTFTGKPGLMKLKTSAAGFEVKMEEPIKTKEFVILHKNMTILHRDCLGNQEINQTPPAGLRDPDFSELMVVGTNDPEKPRKSSLERNDRVEKLKDWSDSDLCPPFCENIGKNPFDPIREFSSDSEPEPTRSDIYPLLDIKADQPDEVTITRRDNGLDIFVKLYCGLGHPPATTNLLLTNNGVEPLEFGLFPIKYPDPLWSERKTGVVYFVEPTGVLEGGEFHILTAVFESNAEGNFAEAFRLWTLPHTTTPRDITIVVEGRSHPKSYLNLPGATFSKKNINENKFLLCASEQLESHVKNVLEKLVPEKGPCSRVPAEETFKTLNNLVYQPEAVTKLKYAWLFAHLKYSDIPWYDTLIQRERQKTEELPGEINKRLLQDLATAQSKINHAKTDKPEYVDFEVPTDVHGFFWRNPAIVYKCPVHDQDLPLPGTTAHFADHEEERLPRTDAASLILSKKKSTSQPIRTLGSLKPTNVHSAPSHIGEAFSLKPDLPPKMSTVKTQPNKKTAELDSDWIPMVVQNDGIPVAPSVKNNPPPVGQAPKKKKHEMNIALNLAEIVLPGASDIERAAYKLALDEKWIKHSINRDWITIAVTFAAQNGEDSKISDKIPEWNLSIGDLREAVQKSQHHIHIKLGLLREISRQEQALARINTSVPLNYTIDDNMEEFLAGSVDFIMKQAAEYATDLLSYFNRVCENTKPDEPPVSENLLKARERVKTLEDSASPPAKSASKFTEAAKTAVTESHAEEPKSRSSSKESDQQKTSLTTNRPSKSAVANAGKAAVSAKDSKKIGLTGPHSEASRAEKDAKHQLAILEAEHETELEKFKVKLTEHEKWREEREAELEPKISAFVYALWEKEISSLDRNVFERVFHLQLEQDLEEENIRKAFLDQRRNNTLLKLYDRLLHLASAGPLSVAAWRSRLTDNIIKQDNLQPNRVKEAWGLTRKEVKLFVKERPNDRCRLELRNIWRAPYTYQPAVAGTDLIPLHSQQEQLSPPTGTQETELITNMPLPNILTLLKDPTKPKSANVRKLPAATAARYQGMLSDPSQVGRGAKAKLVTPVRRPKLSKEEKVVTRVLGDFRECLTEIIENDKNAVEIECDSGDEWETDDEKVVDAWLYEPAGVKETSRLPADFKFVSFKEPAPSSTPNNSKMVKKKKRKDDAVGKDEASSSSDEEYHWKTSRRR